MSERPLSLFKLSAAVAFGLWLGFIAIVLTTWLASRYLFPQSLAPVAQAVQQAVQQIGKPAAVAPEPDKASGAIPLNGQDAKFRR